MIRIADESVCAAREAADVARGPVRPAPVPDPSVFVSVTETDEVVKGARQWQALCFVADCLTAYKNGDRAKVEHFATAHVFGHRCGQGEFQLGLDARYPWLRSYELVLGGAS